MYINICSICTEYSIACYMYMCAIDFVCMLQCTCANNNTGIYIHVHVCLFTIQCTVS